ncbi:chitinase [Amycolatopsis aidingensis]|uniref:chitinase n=1 Tax=Amycolatopsis aidingensis TaxID=2842453 RepID=UPI001C0C7816|nr:glycoside hydrolase family 18 protein [Amycolatopsis aidingensis]
MARTPRRLLAGALPAALVALALLPAGTAQAANIAVNSGFEAGNTTGWTCGAGTEVVGSPVHAGSYALAGTPAGQGTARCAQTITVEPGTDYRLSGWVQGSYTYLGVTGTGSGDRSTWSSGTSWSELAIEFTTGASTTSVTIYVHGWYGQPTYYADDIVLDGPGGGDPDPQLPSAPDGLSGQASGSNAAALSWSAPGGTVTGYHVYRDGTRVASTGTTSYTDTGLRAETTYRYTVSAYNSAGESPRSAAVEVTTAPDGGDPGGELPDHVLTGYWHNFDNGAQPLRIADVPTTYDIIAVAFVDAVPGRNGGVEFTLDPGLSDRLGGYTDAQFRADIRTVQARGQKVILSVGGEKGTVWVGDSAAADNFATDMIGLINDYGFDGVDIDLENGIHPGPMSSALRRIHAAGGEIITMAPQTLDMQSTGNGYFQLALSIKDILTIVNMQYYNSGTMLGCDQQVYAQGTVNFLTALACIQLEGGLRPDQVGLGLPASTRAAGGGYQSPGNVNDALDCLSVGTNCGSFQPSTTYPGIRGAMTWSINWDASNGYRFANTVAPHLDRLP